jgi:ABC-2 type transport system ATP-binding protein
VQKLTVTRRPAPAGAPAVMVRGLRKAFGDHVVLDGIDLDVAKGTVCALLGPNGSGKTTTVQILSTLLPPIWT